MTSAKDDAAGERVGGPAAARPGRIAARAAAAALLVLALGACGDDDGGGTGDGEGGREVIVVIDDAAFAPPDITVVAGGSVTFENRDGQPHTATAEDSSRFDTGRINPEEGSTVTFDTVGTVPYICSYHPFMHGTITVVSG